MPQSKKYFVKDFDVECYYYWCHISCTFLVEKSGTAILKFAGRELFLVNWLLTLMGSLGRRTFIADW